MLSPRSRWGQLFIGLVGLAALFGLIRAALPHGADGRGERGAQSFNALPRPAAVAAAQAGLTVDAWTRAMLTTGSFGDADEMLASFDGRFGTPEGADADGEADAPEKRAFPAIVAAAYVDGRPTVYLRHEEGAIRPWHPGETPVEGWRIEDITLDVVRVRYQQDEPETRRVFDNRVPQAVAEAAEAGRDGG